MDGIFFDTYETCDNCGREHISDRPCDYYGFSYLELDETNMITGLDLDKIPAHEPKYSHQG